MYGRISGNVTSISLRAKIPMLFKMLAARGVRRTVRHTNAGTKGGNCSYTLDTVRVMGLVGRLRTWVRPKPGGRADSQGSGNGKTSDRVGSSLGKY